MECWAGMLMKSGRLAVSQSDSNAERFSKPSLPRRKFKRFSMRSIERPCTEAHILNEIARTSSLFFCGKFRDG